MSIRFKLGAQMGGLRDVAPFPCPFGSGATFRINRAGSKHVRDLRRKRLENDPVQNVVLAVLATDDTVAEIQKQHEQGRKLLTAGVGAEGALSAAAEEEESEIVGRVFRVAGRQAMRDGLISPQQFTASMFSGDEKSIEQAVDLIAGWENLPGEDGPVPYSPEAARELLSMDDPVPEGHEFAGKTVGEAFRLYFDRCSGKAEAFRGEIIEAAAKN